MLQNLLQPDSTLRRLTEKHESHMQVRNIVLGSNFLNKSAKHYTCNFSI
jgi:hypothetical protein